MRHIGSRAAALLLLAWLWPHQAAAIGLCEGTANSFELHQVSERLAQVAVRRHREWCSADRGEEQREEVRFVSITDQRGKAKAMFPEDDKPESLAILKRRVGALARPHAELAAYLSSGGFTAPVPVQSASPKGCVARVVPVKLVDDKDGKTHALWLEVTRGDRRLHRVWIGKGVGTGEQPALSVRAAWFAPRRGIALSYTLDADFGFYDPSTKIRDIVRSSHFAIASDPKLAACF
jgi:hypothetical protein